MENFNAVKGLHNNLTLQPLAVTFGCKHLSFKTRLHSGYGHFLQTATVMIIPHDTHSFWDFLTYKNRLLPTHIFPVSCARSKTRILEQLHKYAQVKCILGGFLCIIQTNKRHDVNYYHPKTKWNVIQLHRIGPYFLLRFLALWGCQFVCKHLYTLIKGVVQISATHLPHRKECSFEREEKKSRLNK